MLVHGTGLSQVIWRGFGYVRDLSADHVVITPDLRGHGRSEKPHEEEAYAPERFTADVELMDLPDPPPPGPDEVLIEVHASGVANWDDLVRTG